MVVRSGQLYVEAHGRKLTVWNDSNLLPCRRLSFSMEAGQPPEILAELAPE